MCPPACIPRRLDININSTDDEVLSFLGGRKAGDTLPSNIITEVNPFSVEPLDSPEGKWYLYNFEVGCSSSQPNTFKAIQTGYWRFMDRLTIYRGNVAAGRKATWEFYVGQVPLGYRTGWLMYDYQIVQKGFPGISVAQDYNSMCRVFLQEDKREIIDDQKSPDTEHCDPLSSDNADGELVESWLLRILQSEESSSPTNAANPFEFGAPEQRQDRSIQDLATGDSTANLNAFVEFSMGEYLELEDLSELESTFSSSDDSSLTSGNSDNCFDAEALLRDLDNESSKIIKDSNKIDHTDSVDDELVIADPSSPTDGCSPETTSPAHESKPKFGAGSSELGSRLRGHPKGPKRTHSGSSASSSSSNGSGSKSVARIARFGKKCCCFAPF